MQVRAEPALVGLSGRRRMRAPRRDATQPLGDEGGQPVAGRRPAARRLRDRGHAPVHRQRVDQGVQVGERGGLEGWRHCPGRRRRHTGPGRRAMLPGRGEGAVDPRAQMGRRRHGRAESAQRDDAAGVHRDHRHLRPPGQRGGLPGHDEAWEVVGDHERRAGRQPRQQSAPLTHLALHPGPVAEPESCRGCRVLPHALENEAMQPEARPGIVEAEALVDHERLAEPAGLGQGVVEGVVVVETAGDLHPVEDVVAARGLRPVVHPAYPRGIPSHGAGHGASIQAWGVVVRE